MPRPLPVVTNPGRLRTELRFVRPQDRDDAVQEAWLAHLQGRDAARAVGTYAQRLRRQRRCVLVNSNVLAAC